jgi:hypothetical protein
VIAIDNQFTIYLDRRSNVTGLKAAKIAFNRWFRNRTLRGHQIKAIESCAYRNMSDRHSPFAARNLRHLGRPYPRVKCFVRSLVDSEKKVERSKAACWIR